MKLFFVHSIFLECWKQSILIHWGWSYVQILLYNGNFLSSNLKYIPNLTSLQGMFIWFQHYILRTFTSNTNLLLGNKPCALKSPVEFHRLVKLLPPGDALWLLDVELLRDLRTKRDIANYKAYTSVMPTLPTCFFNYVYAQTYCIIFGSVVKGDSLFLWYEVDMRYS